MKVARKAARKTLLLRASDTLVRVLEQGQEVARHARCYGAENACLETGGTIRLLRRREVVVAS